MSRKKGYYIGYTRNGQKMYYSKYFQVLPNTKTACICDTWAHANSIMFDFYNAFCISGDKVFIEKI